MTSICRSVDYTNGDGSAAAWSARILRRDGGITGFRPGFSGTCCGLRFANFVPRIPFCCFSIWQRRVRRHCALQDRMASLNCLPEPSRLHPRSAGGEERQLRQGTHGATHENAAGRGHDHERRRRAPRAAAGGANGVPSPQNSRVCEHDGAQKRRAGCARVGARASSATLPST